MERARTSVMLAMLLGLAACGSSGDRELAPIVPSTTTTTTVPTTSTIPITAAATTATTTTVPRVAPTTQAVPSPTTATTSPATTGPTTVIATTAAPATTAPATTAVATSTTVGPLRQGTSGPQVAALQQELIARGFDIEADGTFGPATDAAVRQAQAALGLAADGIVGPRTQAALGLGTARRSTAASVGQLVADAQSFLAGGAAASLPADAVTALTPWVDDTDGASWSIGAPANGPGDRTRQVLTLSQGATTLATVELCMRATAPVEWCGLWSASEAATTTTTATTAAPPAPVTTTVAPTTVAATTAAPTTAAPGATTSTTIADLVQGDSGPEVTALQTELIARGYTLEADGTFGPATDAALREAQATLGIEVDGRLGPVSRAVLGLGTARTSTATTVEQFLADAQVLLAGGPPGTLPADAVTALEPWIDATPGTAWAVGEITTGPGERARSVITLEQGESVLASVEVCMVPHAPAGPVDWCGLWSTSALD